MRISDWSSDVCSSDLQIIAELPGIAHVAPVERVQRIALQIRLIALRQKCAKLPGSAGGGCDRRCAAHSGRLRLLRAGGKQCEAGGRAQRSEEHTSELQSLMRISYAVFCLKKKKTQAIPNHHRHP